MKKIAIIGVGQLGSRHLQSLAKLGDDILVEIVDPNPDSVQEAKKRLYECSPTEHSHVFLFDKTIYQLNDKIDLCIIATNSDIRLQVIKDLLSEKEVNQLILEKFLFQEISHYQIAESLFNERQTKVWVNCPRRVWPMYQFIKNRGGGKKWLSFRVFGSDWGLCSNAIHFLDVFAYLTECSDYLFLESNLDEQLYVSKRKNYIELAGSISGQFKSGEIFDIECLKNGGSIPLSLELINEEETIFINEVKGMLKIVSRKGNKNEEHEFETVYQSNLTHLVASEIFETKSCLLPSYDVSSKLHQTFLKSVLVCLEKKTGKVNALLPIT